MAVAIEQGYPGEPGDFARLRGASEPLWRQRESILEANLSPSPPCAGRMDAELAKQREPGNTMFPERLQSKGSQPPTPC